MSDRLFVLHVSEDGDVTLREIEGGDFDAWMKRDFEGCRPPEFMSELPRNLMSGTGGKYLLIRGRVVVPKAVEVVTKYEV